jgi:hypothetical protein
MQVLGMTTLVFIATAIGTLTGFGSSTVMVPFVVLLFPLPVALLFVGILHWFNDLWKIILFRKRIKWRLLLSFAIPGIIFSFIGAHIALNYEAEILKQILGFLLISYFVYIFINPKFKLSHTTSTAVIGGSLSGVMAGVFGVGGAVRGMFLSAFKFKKHMYLFTSGTIALFIDSSRIIAYINGGTMLKGYLLWGMLLFIPISFLSAEFAKSYLVDNIPEKSFRKVVAIFFALVGAKLMLFP